MRGWQAPGSLERRARSGSVRCSTVAALVTTLLAWCGPQTVAARMGYAPAHSPAYAPRAAPGPKKFKPLFKQPALPATALAVLRGIPSYGAYMKGTETDSVFGTPITSAVISDGVILLDAEKQVLKFNMTLNGAWADDNKLQSILLSIPAAINQSAQTMATLVPNSPQVKAYSADATRGTVRLASNATSLNYLGQATLYPGVSWQVLEQNLQLGRVTVNIYTTNYPEPATPLGCCNNAEIHSQGPLEPLGVSALPPGGLRQDNHGLESPPVRTADSVPWNARLGAAEPIVLTQAGGLIDLLVAPDNTSVIYNVTMGGFEPSSEIYNVTVWFGTGASRRLGWYPYSLYSFAADRLPTPSGGLVTPRDGGNFTLATGWIGKFVEKAASTGFMDPSFDYGVQQLQAGNVYVIIGTSRYPQGELAGHATVGYAAA